MGYKVGDKAKNISTNAKHHDGSPKGPVSLLCPPHPHTNFYFPVQASDKTILYSVASALVNCTNSYDTKELVPELVQLAKFSKQHVPEEHPKVGCVQLEMLFRKTFFGVSIVTDFRSPVSILKSLCSPTRLGC